MELAKRVVWKFSSSHIYGNAISLFGPASENHRISANYTRERGDFRTKERAGCAAVQLSKLVGYVSAGNSRMYVHLVF